MIQRYKTTTQITPKIGGGYEVKAIAVPDEQGDFVMYDAVSHLVEEKTVKGNEVSKGEEYFCDPSIIGKTVEVISIVAGGAVYGKNRKIINADWVETPFRYKGVITRVYPKEEYGAVRVEYLTQDGMYLGFYPQDIGENLKVVVYN